jgi:hypothetical protein
VSPGQRPLRSPSAAARGLTTLLNTHGRRVVECAISELTRRGDYGAPITTGPDRTVLLFYEDIERDRVVRYDRYLTRAARRVYHALTDGQRVSGFEIVFGLLVRALREAGCRVVVNNPALARRHPDHPVGIAGYPHVLDRWRLPNPAVLGPGLLDHPAERPDLMRDPRFRSYLVPCDWMQDMFAPYYPGVCRPWFGGIDVNEWPDSTHAPKDIDFLVYDKVRWDRSRVVPALLEPIERELDRRGLRHQRVLRGAYDHAGFRTLLSRSRAMLFVAEHETQGLAYQEAMACGVPILAWDPRRWLDPNRHQWITEEVPASSVPFFSPACGERFADASEFGPSLDRFLTRLPSYAPRAYVRDALSFERSAALYLEAYTAAARTQHHAG